MFMPKVHRTREVVAVSIPLELAARLREEARRRRRPISHLAEEALKNYLPADEPAGGREERGGPS